METKHTPGPWKQWGEYQVRDQQNRILVSTSDAKTMENKANTHLIAAAPELLKACKEMLAHERCVCEEGELEKGNCLCCSIEKIIAKAEGK